MVNTVRRRVKPRPLILDNTLKSVILILIVFHSHVFSAEEDLEIISEQNAESQNCFADLHQKSWTKMNILVSFKFLIIKLKITRRI